MNNNNNNQLFMKKLEFEDNITKYFHLFLLIFYFKNQLDYLNVRKPNFSLNSIRTYYF